MIRDTSLAAFDRINLTAGQQRVLTWCRSHAAESWTRQDIADGSGMKLQTVCGRVHELLESGLLAELPAVNGKHPLRLLDVDTGSEAWRHACEVRHVVGLRSDEARAEYLAGVQRKRGQDAYARLRRDAWAAMSGQLREEAA